MERITSPAFIASNPSLICKRVANPGIYEDDGGELATEIEQGTLAHARAAALRADQAIGEVVVRRWRLRGFGCGGRTWDEKKVRGLRSRGNGTLSDYGTTLPDCGDLRAENAVHAL